MNPTRTVYEEMTSSSPTTMVPMIRNILGSFLFSGDDIYKRVSVLSGGERNRLALAKMLLNPSNLLLLDEPTNHLDLDSKEVLLEALADYSGTLVFVSHDRYFVDRLAEKVIEVGGGQARSIRRDEEFLSEEQGGRRRGCAVAVARAAPTGAPDAAGDRSPPRNRQGAGAVGRRRRRAAARPAGALPAAPCTHAPVTAREKSGDTRLPTIRWPRACVRRARPRTGRRASARRGRPGPGCRTWRSRSRRRSARCATSRP